MALQWAGGLIGLEARYVFLLGFFCISGICLVSGGINKSLAQAPMTKKVIN